MKTLKITEAAWELLTIFKAENKYKNYSEAIIKAILNSQEKSLYDQQRQK